MEKSSIHLTTQYPREVARDVTANIDSMQSRETLILEMVRKGAFNSKNSVDLTLVSNLNNRFLEAGIKGLGSPHIAERFAAVRVEIIDKIQAMEEGQKVSLVVTRDDQEVVYDWR